MKLKVQVMTLEGLMRVTTVDVLRLDVSVAVKKAVQALNLIMSDVYEAHIVTVEGPTEVCSALRKRLLAVLDNRPKMIVPVLKEKIVVASAGILPSMSNSEVQAVGVKLTDCVKLAKATGRDDIMIELDPIIWELESYAS